MAQPGTGLAAGPERAPGAGGAGADRAPWGGRLVVVGGSAGGVEALGRLVDRLPPDLPAAVVVALHLAAGARSLLPEVLARHGRLLVVAATDGQRLGDGRVHVAPADAHLVVEGARLRLGRGPRENGHRPSVDVLLRSAAVAHGPAVIGVVLTGMLDDGSAGLRAVVRHGGTALVQDPDEAEFPSMPRSALAATGCRALALDELAAEVVRLVRADLPPAPATAQVPAPEPRPQARGAAPPEHVAPDAIPPVGPAPEPGAPEPGAPEPGAPEHARRRDRVEVGSALGEPPTPGGGPLGDPPGYSCPDCGGVLQQLDDGRLLRFRCRVGHAWSADSLVERQGVTVEGALWTALRALQEREEVSRRLAADAEASGRGWSSRHFRDRADEATRSARLLRSLLDGPLPESGDESGAVAAPP